MKNIKKETKFPLDKHPYYLKITTTCWSCILHKKYDSYTYKEENERKYTIIIYYLIKKTKAEIQNLQNNALVKIICLFKDLRFFFPQKL